MFDIPQLLERGLGVAVSFLKSPTRRQGAASYGLYAGFLIGGVVFLTHFFQKTTHSRLQGLALQAQALVRVFKDLSQPLKGLISLIEFRQEDPVTEEYHFVRHPSPQHFHHTDLPDLLRIHHWPGFSLRGFLGFFGSLHRT